MQLLQLIQLLSQISILKVCYCHMMHAQLVNCLTAEYFAYLPLLQLHPELSSVAKEVKNSFCSHLSWIEYFVLFSTLLFFKSPVIKIIGLTMSPLKHAYNPLCMRFGCHCQQQINKCAHLEKSDISCFLKCVPPFGRWISSNVVQHRRLSVYPHVSPLASK